MNKINENVVNFRQLIDIAERNDPNHIVYEFKKILSNNLPEIVKVKYCDFKKDMVALSTALLNLGLEGEKIALVGNNSYRWCISYLAITTGNMVVVPLDKALPENELENLIKRSGATCIIFENRHREVIEKVLSEDDNIVKYAIAMDIEKDENNIKSFDNLLEEGKTLISNGDNRYNNIIIDNKKMTAMIFTSGTTNTPKAVMLSQYNICSNVVAFSHYAKVTKDDTLLSFLPIHHTFECTATFLFGLYSGATVAFCDGLKHLQDNLKEYNVSVLFAVPLVLETMYKKMLKDINENKEADLVNKFKGNLRLVLCGSAPLNVDTIHGFNSLGIEFIQGYGLTEASPIISAETNDMKRPGSIGRVLDNLEIKIADPDITGVGEITVKGPSVMIGYYNNKEETDKVLKDGWLSTGDYGYLDDDGFLFITGRKKDLIVLKNGKNVYPQELEALINRIPYVVESIVYPREETSLDTALCAQIVYSEDLIVSALGNKSEEEYKEILWNEIKKINQSLPIYKHIKQISITTVPFSKTTTQKIKRYEVLKNLKVALV